ncbi:MAG: DUF3459 domain-containing protein [Phycisphaeraceae bacterium]|nr:DUF3459 domain-containing protein [Phycisphaeraceae bacterium]
MRSHTTRMLIAGACLYAAAVQFTLGQATTNPSAAVPPTQAAGERFRGPVREGWWNDAVFYEVFVRSFYDSREGPLANDGVGDLRGLIARLDYLNDGNPATTTDLGVTGIWLMPITESPSYHGYDTTDYLTIDREYGTNEDFKVLIAECHKRGIRVIIDLVLNHCSNRHEWFRLAADPGDPHHDWFIWSDSDPGYRGPWNQKVWHPLTDRSAGGPYFYGCFSRQMPDLNYANPAVTAEMNRTIAYWLDDMGADGFRLDAIRHLIENGPNQDNTPQTHDWLRGFYTFYKARNPEAFTVGEVWSTTDVISTYVGDQMDTSFEFQLAQAVMDAANTGDAAPLARAAAGTWAAFPRNQFATFLTNHDQARVMTVFKGDESKARLAAGLLLTLPGIPFIYYGEEIGMSGDKPDEWIRTPMQWDGSANAGFAAAGVTPWERLNADAETRNVKGQEGETGSLLGLYQKLTRLRLDHAALRRGEFEVVPSGSPRVLAFRRWMGDEQFLVIANLGAEPVSGYRLELGEGIADRLKEAGAVEVLHGEPVASGGEPIARLAPRSVYVVRVP